jgi:hypothetical protein
MLLKVIVIKPNRDSIVRHTFRRSGCTQIWFFPDGLCFIYKQYMPENNYRQMFKDWSIFCGTGI